MNEGIKAQTPAGGEGEAEEQVVAEAAETGNDVLGGGGKSDRDPLPPGVAYDPLDRHFNGPGQFDAPENTKEFDQE